MTVTAVSVKSEAGNGTRELPTGGPTRAEGTVFALPPWRNGTGTIRDLGFSTLRYLAGVVGRGAVGQGPCSLLRKTSAAFRM